MRNLVCGLGFVWLLFNVLFINPLNAQNPLNIRPMQETPLLSGSFGELRATHFHSGVDFRTGGRIGLPVLCVTDGVVARIKISPVGYGNALYVEHPDGTTTVYGHLSRYNKKITRIARELQYRNESFEIDEDTKGYGLFFKKGDTIAFSGNSGSSGGPHLHFEYRNTVTEHTLNPLLWYKVRDNMAPKVNALYVYGISASGCVGQARRVAVSTADGRRYTSGVVTVPAGKTGLGVFALDVMNDSQSKLGVYKIIMRAGDKELFRLLVDSCSFDQNGLINELKDYGLYRQKSETVYRMFGNYLHELLGVKMQGNGCIDIAAGEVIPVEIQVADINGNTSTVTLKLKGGNAVQNKETDVLPYDKAYVLKADGYTLQLDSGALLSSVPGFAKIDTLTTAAGQKYRSFVVSRSDVPLKKSVKLQLTGKYDDKTVICRLDDGLRRSVMQTVQDSAGIHCFTNVLGKYTTAKDTVAPSIAYLGQAGQELRFRLGDNMTGVARYRMEVNGKWCLFVYDAKSSLLTCNINEPAFEKGKTNQVKLTVGDAVGNTSEKTVSIKK